MRRYLTINGSRWDLVSENRPFVGTTPMPPGHALYPADLTRAQIDSYVASHPGKKDEIYNPYTFVRRQGQDARRPAVPRRVHAVRRRRRDGAARAPRRSRRIRRSPGFCGCAPTRLSTDDYYASDVAWVELQNPKVDVIFAPYETYLDDLLGVKTSYGAAILIRNEAESRNLAKYQQWVPDIQDALPLPAADRPSVRGHVTPMEVMDAPFRAGDLRHGYQAVADNLPNDPRIHQEKGTKKIFFKNFMDARVTEVILPLAARVMDPAQARRASAEGYLASTVMHEICHGLGPAFARRDGQQVDVREAIGKAYSGLEEAKADVVGMFALKWLIDRDVLAEGPAGGVLRVVPRRHFPDGPVRHRRGARTRRDDGVQLPVRAGRDRADGRTLPRGLREDARRRSSVSPRSCSNRRRPAIARAPRRGSPSTTRCPRRSARRWRRPPTCRWTSIPMFSFASASSESQAVCREMTGRRTASRRPASGSRSARSKES